MTTQPELMLSPDTRPVLTATSITTDALPASDAVPSRALVKSIKRWGVMVPILVAPPDTVPNDTTSTDWIVYDGKRRVAAAQRVAAEEGRYITIPAVYPASVDHLAAVLTLMTNSVRSDNQMAEADAIQRLFAMGASEREAAAATGMTVGTIRKRMKVAALHPDLLQAARTGRMTYGVAEKAAALTPAEQRTLVGCATTEADGDIDSAVITADDVAAVRRVVSANAAAQLPADLFAPSAAEAAARVDPAVEVLRLLGEAVRYAKGAGVTRKVFCRYVTEAGDAVDY